MGIIQTFLFYASEKVPYNGMNCCQKRKMQGGNEYMVTNTEVKVLGHFINGEIVAGTSGHFSDVSIQVLGQ